MVVWLTKNWSFFDQNGGYSKQCNGWLTMSLPISLNYRTVIKVSKYLELVQISLILWSNILWSVKTGLYRAWTVQADWNVNYLQTLNWPIPLGWFPFCCNDHRICLLRFFKEDFKAVNTSLTSISCERSILIIITTTQSHRPRSIYKTSVCACACDSCNQYGNQALRSFFFRYVAHAEVILENGNLPTNAFNSKTIWCLLIL